jgi:hypothetical protein
MWDTATSGKYINYGRWSMALDNGNFFISIPSTSSNGKISLSTMNVDSSVTNYMSMNYTGNFNFYNTDDSTATSNGSVVLSGGLGVAKNICSSNFQSQSGSLTISQAGLTINQTLVFAKKVKIGDIVRIMCKITLGTVSGTYTGQPTFTVPASWTPSFTALYRNAYFEVDQVKQDWSLSTTAGSSTVSLINNGGGFINLASGTTLYFDISYVI